MTMQRTNAIDGQRSSLLKQVVDLHAIFANDVCIIPTRLIQPVTLPIHLVGIQVSTNGTKRTKRICREKRSRCQIKGNHDFWPVNHRCCYKLQDMFAELQGIPFGYHNGIGCRVKIMELANEIKSLGGTNQFDRRIFFYQPGNLCTMIGLHMVNYHIVQLAVTEHILQILTKLTSYNIIHTVKKTGLLVKNEIAVIGHAIRNVIGILKQG